VPMVSNQLAQMPATAGSAAIAEGPEWIAVGNLPPPNTQQTVAMYSSRFSGIMAVDYTADGKLLKGNDSRKVSPPFELNDGHKDAPPLVFTLMMFPKQGEGKGGNSFRKSRGIGTLQLKCEAPRNPNDPENPLESHAFKVWFVVGKDRRGPIIHDFAQSGSICGLPKGFSQEWDFNKADFTKAKGSETFVVRVEVLPIVPGQIAYQ